MNKSTPLILAAFVAAAVLPVAAAEMPKVGDPAPNVTAKDQDGKEWQVPAPGKIILLYFYPKDDTPGCTKEACGFRDQIGDLKKAGVEVLGVSFDSAESHQKFISKYNLNFPLLVDPNGKLADAYGVRMPGKSMANRVSFLIGPDGKIRHVTNTMKAETHLAEMKQAVQQMNKG